MPVEGIPFQPSSGEAGRIAEGQAPDGFVETPLSERLAAAQKPDADRPLTPEEARRAHLANVVMAINRHVSGNQESAGGEEGQQKDAALIEQYLAESGAPTPQDPGAWRELASQATEAMQTGGNQEPAI